MEYWGVLLQYQDKFYHYNTYEEKSNEFWTQINCIKTNGAAEYWKNNN
jgi:hypothetical protein